MSDITQNLTGMRTLNDYINADAQRRLIQAQGQQTLQTGQIDAATKANTFKTQIMSAGAAGGQQAYDAAKQQLHGMGIDTSEYAPDAATGQTQAEQARMSLVSALGMANLAQKNWSNTTQAAGVNGQNAPNSPPPFPGLNAVVPPPSNPPNPPTPQGAGPDLQPLAATTGQTADVSGQPASALPVDNTAPRNPGMTLNSTVDGPVANGFQPSAGPVNENPDAKIKRIASELAVYQANPNNAAQLAQMKAKAEAQGKDQGTQPLKVAASEETYGRVTKNLDAMLSVNNDVPQQGLLESSGFQAGVSQHLGNLPGGDNQKAANAYNSFTKVNKAQVLNGLQELLQSSTGIRSSRQLISLIDSVNGIDPNASPVSREQQINAVKNELYNWKVSEENINAKLNGGSEQSFNDIPMNAGASAPSGNKAVHYNDLP